MKDLRAIVSRIEPEVIGSPWSGFEHVRGWGVFAMPLDSGYVLALRVFPVNDFAPYVTVWSRDRDGAWSIFVDGPRVETACPRYYGPAAKHVVRCAIELRWTGPARLTVLVDEPALEWSMSMRSTRLLDVVNALSARMPLWTWKPAPLVALRNWMARRLLGMGDVQLSGRMPSGHVGTLMPQQMYFISEARAVLEGRDLGRPTHVAENPRIGGVPLPARPVFAVGQAHWRIVDPDEYRRTRAELAARVDLSTTSSPAQPTTT